MNELSLLAPAQTMTSREIAELTGKNHADVMRDIRVMIDKLSANAELLWHCISTTYNDDQGKPRHQYELDRDTSLILVTGYDVVRRARLVNRWAVLEAQAKPTVPQNFADALLLAYQQQVQIDTMQKQIALDAPKVKFMDQVTSENNPITINDYAKLLSEANEIVIGPNKLMDYLREHGYLMKGRATNERNKPYQKYIEVGLFVVEYIATPVGTRPQPMITTKGQMELADSIVDHFG